MEIVATLAPRIINCQITKTGFNVSLKGNVTYQTMKFEWVSPPQTRDSYGITGQVSFDDDFFYICVGPNRWTRTILTKGW